MYQQTTLDLFGNTGQDVAGQERIASGTVVLHQFALADEAAILTAMHAVIAQAPLRHMETPGGFRMSVAMTNCGQYGWVTDGNGYRYDAVDPLCGKRWPEMPAVFKALACKAAAGAGFEDFTPDACLINRYLPGARMSLHQDRDEHDFGQPIVSVSLGIPALFLFGGLRREEKPARIPLTHADVIVWGGPDRLRYHGILPLKQNQHGVLGSQRFNLTFRRAR